MTDREILELAAKAAGGTFKSAESIYIRGTLWTPNGWPEEWNPLEDDGDAFRLMTQLDITVNCNRDELTVIVQSWRPKLCKAVRTNNTDADVRRAIVEVAAMIGKLLK